MFPHRSPKFRDNDVRHSCMHACTTHSQHMDSLRLCNRFTMLSRNLPKPPQCRGGFTVSRFVFMTDWLRELRQSLSRSGLVDCRQSSDETVTKQRKPERRKKCFEHEQTQQQQQQSKRVHCNTGSTHLAFTPVQTQSHSIPTASSCPDTPSFTHSTSWP